MRNAGAMVMVWLLAGTARADDARWDVELPGGTEEAKACEDAGGGWRVDDTDAGWCAYDGEGEHPTAEAALALATTLHQALDVPKLYALAIDPTGKVAAKLGLGDKKAPKLKDSPVGVVVLTDAKTFKRAKVGKPATGLAGAPRLYGVPAARTGKLSREHLAAVRTALLAATGAADLVVTDAGGHLGFAKPGAN